MTRPTRAGRLLAASVLAFCLPAANAGPPPLLPEDAVAALAAELSGAAARRTVEELALHHRMRGSRGFAAAAEAIRARAAAAGLADVEILELPADGEIFYGSQRSRPAWDAEQAELWEQRERAGAWSDARLIADWQSRPVTLAQDSVSGEVTADLVDVGDGTSGSDYEGKEVRGRLVLAAAQPGAVAPLAVTERGAAGIISYAQNQRSAWWGEDRNLVRWGHVGSFPPPETFAFMVSVNQALTWRERLAAGDRVRLRAVVRAERHPGVYAIPSARIPGADPDLSAQEILFSCHLDHQRPGANDNASGCAAILEAGRALAKLVREGRLPPPRRGLRFVWPPEIEGTLALVNARPDLVARARAVIHLDMVGGDAEITKAVFHVTRAPASLPTFVSDVAEAFGRFVNAESYAYAAGGSPDYPLVDAEGRRRPLAARFAPFSTGSDHQVWTEGSFRVPAIYLNDWPDRYIHTHADRPGNLDPTKLLRAAFLAAASGYSLAMLGEEGVPDLLAVVRRQALARASEALARAGESEAAEAENLLHRFLDRERAVVASVERFAPIPAAERQRSAEFFDHLGGLLGLFDTEPSAPAAGATRCRRRPDPKGPLWAFGYSWFEDHRARLGLERPGLLDYRGLWGGGSEYAYEVLNLVDGRRTVGAIRDVVAAAYGAVPLDLVRGYLETLERIGVVECGAAPPVGWTAAPTGPLAERAPAWPPPAEVSELALAGYAKVLCSAVFITGRDPEEAARDSAFIFLPPGGGELIQATAVDRERRAVRVTGAGGISRTARQFGDQGCVILPRRSDGVHFRPLTVATTLPDAESQDWPMGDRLPATEPDARRRGIERAVEAAFDPAAMTAAFLAVHRGRIVAERYGEGVDRDTQLESWSMGKSLTATLIGRLVHEGDLDLDGPAPVAAWAGPDDPRSEIRVRDLLRMSSGLRFIAPQDPDYRPELGYPDHMYVYTGAIDAFDFAVGRPLQFPPNSTGRYRNADPLVLGYLVREAARARGEEYLAFPQKLLFDRIGIRRQVLEPDPWGNFLLTGYDYGSARNWARLGLLYLNDGVWQGERLLPAGWARFAATPAPAWDRPVYGGMFWLNRTGVLALPEDAYWMAGAGGQHTIIVPSLDLVVVRMGHLRGGPEARPALNRALEMLVEALGGVSTPPGGRSRGSAG